MQGEKRSLTTAKITKDYLSNNEIPQLFECLMTGLMYHRPTDFITYLEDCLKTIRKHGVNGLRWDMFLENRKTSLPPIDPTPKEDYRPQPLPDIGSFQLRMAFDASVIIIMSGPGINRKAICKELCTKFPNYFPIEVGTILRNRALIEAQQSNSRWKTVQDEINKGELAPSFFVTETLITELNKHSDKKHFLIEGYPRTDDDREAFERFIGFNRLKFMLLVDCEEEVCRQNLKEQGTLNNWQDSDSAAIDNRICNYQLKTLPVIRFFDDHQKLRSINGDRHQSLVMKDINELFTQELNEHIVPHPPSTPKDRQSAAVSREQSTARSPGPRAITEILQLTGISPEEDRSPDLPQCHLVLLLGGPGSGKSEVASRVCSEHQGWFHLDVNEWLQSSVMATDSPDNDLATCDDNPSFVENWRINIKVLKETFKSIPEDTEIVILEGYPKDSEQLNQFNSQIGRPDCVVLLDSEEDVMHARLAKRFSHTEGVKEDELNNDYRIGHFKGHGLSLCRYYDERCKLSIISADRNLIDVVSEFETLLTKKFNDDKDEVVANDIDNTDQSIQIVDDAVMNAAATRIQASIRGHLTRKSMGKRSEKDTNNNAVVYDEENIENEKVDSLEDNKDETEADDEVKEDNPTNPDIEETEADDEVKKDNPTNPDIEETNENKETEDEPSVVEDVIEPDIQAPLGDLGVRTTSQLELRNAFVILLLGGPGSGKKTLGSYIVSKFAISFVHADQIINTAIESGSEESEELQKYLANEDCDETPVYTLIRKSLFNQLNVSKVLCLAGFPKTVEQYRRFVDDVCPISATIFLDVSEDILKSRLSDQDQSSDFSDQIEAFNNNCPALLEEIAENDQINKIDGSQDLDNVMQQVTDVIENFHFMKPDE